MEFRKPEEEFEFIDGSNNTYLVRHLPRYIEVSLVLVNFDKKTEDVMIIGDEP